MSSRSIGVTNVVVEPLDQVVRDPVALLLADQDVAARGPALSGQLRSSWSSRSAAADDVAAGLLEQVEELAVGRGEHLGEPRHGGGPVRVRKPMWTRPA